MHTFLQDLRYALRTLRKKPGFTAVAILSLTLGIGANTTIFTLMKAFFLQAIPVKDASRVVYVFSTQQSRGGQMSPFLPSSYLNAMDYRQMNDAFSGLSLVWGTGVGLDIGGQTKAEGAQLVDYDFFDILGARPMLGRTFEADEDQTPGARPVAILSHDLWVREFASDPGIVGKTVRLNDLDFAVVGVMGPEFHNVAALGTWDLWAPMMMRDQLVTGPQKGWPTHRSFRMMNMVGRLKPGVSLARAQASMHALGDRLAKAYPAENSGRNVNLVPLDQTFINPAQRDTFVLAGTLMMVVVALVLLIACGNVANLLLTRATHRQREVAIRRALGASRGRVILQLLTESALIGLASMALGILLAYSSRTVLVKFLLGGVPPNLDLSLDLRVLGFTLGVSLAAVMLFGLAPAVQATRGGRSDTLRERAQTQSGALKWYGLRGSLVMGEITLCLVALAGAGLFIHSLHNAQLVDPGFETKHEVFAFANLPPKYTAQQAILYYQQVLDRVKALPMVAEAGISSNAPFNGSFSSNMFPEGTDRSDPRNGRQTPTPTVMPGFFSAAGIPLLSGRDFTDHDNGQTEKVAIINQAAAEQFWPEQSAIGKHVFFHSSDGSDWNVEIVGTVATVKYQTLGEAPQPQMYLAAEQQSQTLPASVVWVKAKGNPEAALPGIEQAMKAVDPAVRIPPVLTMSWLMDQVLANAKLGAEALAGFGALALLLAMIGTYGVMSYSVSQRTQEIGIRMALGAQPRDVLRLMLGTGMAMVLGGIGAGWLLTLALTHSLNSLLYGIGIFDPISFFATATLMIAVALLACWIPSRRAMNVSPVIALRYE